MTQKFPEIAAPLIQRIRTLWPLALLLMGEGLGLWVTSIYAQELPVSVFSALTAVIILATGLLPAILRPSNEHLVAGCLATVFAAFLLIPFDPPLELLIQTGPRPEYLSSYLLFRLVNGAAIGPLMLHLSSRFPRRSTIGNRLIAGMYAASAILLTTFFRVTVLPLKKSIFIFMVFWLFGLVAWSVGLLVRASRITTPEERRTAQQARLLIFSLLLANSGLFLRLALIPLQGVTLSYNVALGPQIFLPLGITYAIMRHDLFDIDAALRRALAYGALSLILLAAYLGSTVLLTARLAQRWPQFRGLAAAIGVLAAAAAFEPLRARLQRAIDRWLYPDRLRFQQAVAETRRSLTQVISREDVINLLTEAFPQKIGAAWGSLSLAPAPDIPGSFESEPVWNSRLIVGGASLGRYWLGPRRAGPTFDKDEQSQLSGLVGQAALALAYAETIAALNTLNRQLEGRVAERTEQVLNQQRALAVINERQRLARELHDSVTQTLFSINLAARALRGLLEKDPQKAATELHMLEDSAQAAQREMRTLMTQLRNPDEHESLPAYANFSSILDKGCDELRQQTGVNTTLQRPEALLLASQQANEIWAIIKEALQNVAKHSGVQAAICRVEQLPEGLEIHILDQGQGFAVETLPASGHYGLRGMQERAAQMNGRIEIQSQPGTGTKIILWIPR